MELLSTDFILPGNCYIDLHGSLFWMELRRKMADDHWQSTAQETLRFHSSTLVQAGCGKLHKSQGKLAVGRTSSDIPRFFPCMIANPWLFGYPMDPPCFGTFHLLHLCLFVPGFCRSNGQIICFQWIRFFGSSYIFASLVTCEACGVCFEVLKLVAGDLATYIS